MNLEDKVLQVPTQEIIPNRFQPRLNFDDQGLEELALSIKQHGIIQPLVLRRVGDKYEIIAGERRYKAAVKAGLKIVPAIVSDIDDNKSAEVAIVENVQRRNLTPIEEARSYKNLLDKGYLTQSELAKKMGISQSAIANKLRLLNLDEEVQQALLNNEISERHARSLLVLPNNEDQKRWLQKILKERLTVRQLDDGIKAEMSGNNDSSDEDIPLVRPLDIDAIRNEATDLPKINGGNEIQKRLEEIERERMFNPDVIPVEQATNNAKNNFFNFLEDEKVNMNMEEINLETPPINITLPNASDENEEMKEELSNNEKQAEEFNKNFGFLNNSSSINEVLKAEPQEVSTNDKKPSQEFNNSFGFLNNLPDKKEEPVFDPVDLIDTLDDNYEIKIQEQKGLDLKTAINEIRNTKDNLSMKGFNINMEETDLTDSYQFTIKINKN